MNGIFGVISAKLCTFDIARFFAIPQNSAFHGLLEAFLFIYHKIQNFYYIGNHFVGKFLTFPDNPYLRLPPKGDIADIGKFCHEVRGIVIIFTNLFVLPGFLSKSRIHYHNVNLRPKVNRGIKKNFSLYRVVASITYIRSVTELFRNVSVGIPPVPMM